MNVKMLTDLLENHTFISTKKENGYWNKMIETRKQKPFISNWLQTILIISIKKFLMNNRFDDVLTQMVWPMKQAHSNAFRARERECTRRRKRVR